MTHQIPPNLLQPTPEQTYSEEQMAFLRRIMEEFIAFNAYLGVKLTEIRPGYAEMRIPFRDEFIGNPLRRAIHGGLVATLIDTVGGAAAMTTLNSHEDSLSTIDMRVDFLRPGRPMDLIGQGHIVRSGNRIIVTKISVLHPDSPDPIAEGTAVYNVRRKEPMTGK